MVDKQLIINLVEEKLDQDMFLVDVLVSTTNVIHVLVDSFSGVTIEQCVKISRHIEHSLNRDEDDFELQVSSPGLTESFKVLQQYKKYTGKEVVVETLEGEKIQGKMTLATDDEITIETSKREKVEGHKKKQLVVKNYKLKYEEIKSAKAVISFK